MSNVIKSSFIIYNSFLNEKESEGKYKLSVNELYFYALLAAMESKFLGYTETNLNMIYENQFTFNDSNKSRNIASIKNILIKLEKMKVIQIVKSEEKISSTTKLRINFPFLSEGYEHIYHDLWNMVSSPEELFVLIMLKRFNGFQKAKEDWSALLGYSSKNTGIGIINKMVSDEKIYSIEGDFYKDNQGRLKQKPTKWYIGKKPEQNKQVEISVQHDEEENVSNERGISDESGIEWGNWKNGNLTENDYVLYIKQESNVEFMKVAQDKINRITKNGKNDKAHYAINKQIEDARQCKRQQDYYRNEKLKQIMLNEKNDSEYTAFEFTGKEEVYHFNNINKLRTESFNDISKIYYDEVIYVSTPDGDGLGHTGNTGVLDLEKEVRQYLDAEQTAKIYSAIIDCLKKDNKLHSQHVDMIKYRINDLQNSGIDEYHAYYKKVKDKQSQENIEYLEPMDSFTHDDESDSFPF